MRSASFCFPHSVFPISIDERSTYKMADRGYRNALLETCFINRRGGWERIYSWLLHESLEIKRTLVTLGRLLFAHFLPLFDWSSQRFPRTRKVGKWIKLYREKTCAFNVLLNAVCSKNVMSPDSLVMLGKRCEILNIFLYLSYFTSC